MTECSIDQIKTQLPKYRDCGLACYHSEEKNCKGNGLYYLPNDNNDGLCCMPMDVSDEIKTIDGQKDPSSQLSGWCTIDKTSKNLVGHIDWPILTTDVPHQVIFLNPQDTTPVKPNKVNIDNLCQNIQKNIFKWPGKIPQPSCSPGYTWSGSGTEPCTPCTKCSSDELNKCTTTTDTICKVPPKPPSIRTSCINDHTWSVTGTEPCTPCKKCSSGELNKCTTITDTICKVPPIGKPCNSMSKSECKTTSKCHLVKNKCVLVGKDSSNLPIIIGISGGVLLLILIILYKMNKKV